MRYIWMNMWFFGTVVATIVPPGSADRRINEITFVMAHNAASQTNSLPPLSGLRSVSGGSVIGTLVDLIRQVLNLGVLPDEIKTILEKLFEGNPVADQDKSLDEQLNDGVGAFKLPIHFYEGVPYVCHTMLTIQINKLRCDIQSALRSALPFPKIREGLLAPINFFKEHNCKLDTTSRPLVDVFRVINAWLDQHPEEVFTIFLNNVEYSSMVLQRKDDFKRDLEQSGLAQKQYMYKPGQPWPTVREMITSGKRVILFSDVASLESIGIYDKDALGVGSGYEFKTIDKLRGDNQKPKTYWPMNVPEQRWRSDVHNRIAIIDHYVTPSLAGDAQKAREANEYDFVLQRLTTYEKTFKHQVNFLMADFYELPTMDDLMKAVADYNTKHIFAPDQLVPYRSDNAGAVGGWKRPHANIRLKFLANAPDGALWGLSHDGALSKSSDAGKTWQKVGAKNGLERFAIAPNGDLWGVDNNGQVYTSTDQGKSWVEKWPKLSLITSGPETEGDEYDWAKLRQTPPSIMVLPKGEKTAKGEGMVWMTNSIGTIKTSKSVEIKDQAVDESLEQHRRLVYIASGTRSMWGIDADNHVWACSRTFPGKTWVQPLPDIRLIWITVDRNDVPWGINPERRIVKGSKDGKTWTVVDPDAHIMYPESNMLQIIFAADGALWGIGPR